MHVCNITDYVPYQWLAYLHVYVTQKHGCQCGYCSHLILVCAVY